MDPLRSLCSTGHNFSLSPELVKRPQNKPRQLWYVDAPISNHRDGNKHPSSKRIWSHCAAALERLRNATELFPRLHAAKLHIFHNQETIWLPPVIVASCRLIKEWKYHQLAGCCMARQGWIFCHVAPLVLAFSRKKLSWNWSKNKKVERSLCPEVQLAQIFTPVQGGWTRHIQSHFFHDSHTAWSMILRYHWSHQACSKPPPGSTKPKERKISFPFGTKKVSAVCLPGHISAAVCLPIYVVGSSVICLDTKARSWLGGKGGGCRSS